MKKNIKISKLDAAKRQLETVIRLYFHDADPVSIHTLVAAAYTVVKDVNRKRGGEPMIFKEKFLEYVRPEYIKEAKEKLNAAENFFKHADRDHDATIDFNPDQSEMLIIEACTVYQKLTGEFPPLFRIYLGWFIAHNQKLYNFTDHFKETLNVSVPTILNMSRQEYFNTLLPIAMSIRI